MRALPFSFSSRFSFLARFQRRDQIRIHTHRTHTKLLEPSLVCTPLPVPESEDYTRSSDGWMHRKCVISSPHSPAVLPPPLSSSPTHYDFCFSLFLFGQISRFSLPTCTFLFFLFERETKQHVERCTVRYRCLLTTSTRASHAVVIMMRTTARAFLDGRPVPATLTAAQVMTLFPRGVMGLRATHVPVGDDDDDDGYVFPLTDGTLMLTPGRHYTMAPPPSSSSTLPIESAMSASRPLTDASAVTAGPGARSTTDASVRPPAWGPELPAFTPPVAADETTRSRARYPTRRRQESQDLSQPAPATVSMFSSGSARDATHAALPEMDRSVASSVSEIMEDGPSVSYLMTDLHMYSTNTQPRSQEVQARPDEDEEETQNWYVKDEDVGDDDDAAPQEAEEEAKGISDTREQQQLEDISQGTPQTVGMQSQRPGKLVQDRVHEHVLLPMLAIDIVDTPEFQRLRGLKQLGTTVYLYPGATHTRFEHCIGVAHLASQMVRSIAARQPELRITEADILCVTVAGLCHDIGHGPFSHLFEEVIEVMRRDRAAASILAPTSQSNSTTSLVSPVNRERGSTSTSSAAAAAAGYWQTPHRQSRRADSAPRYDQTIRRDDRTSSTPVGKSQKNKKWSHEVMSIQMLRTILGRIELSDYGLNDADANFIELCILGLPPSMPWPENVGRPPHKRFLVDIVANKRHGIDVDKLDYFLRDSLGVYGKAAADVHFPRLLSACRVMPFDGQFQICYEEKLALNLGDIFAVRAKLHKYAYQHRIVKVTDYMVSDALTAADPYFRIAGTNGRMLRISEAVDDEHAFCQLGDWILDAIAASGEPKLAPAREIIGRLTRRDLYQIVGQATFGVARLQMTEANILEDLVQLAFDVQIKQGKHPEWDDETRAAHLRATIIVSFTRITYGSSGSDGVPDDPISNVTFYNPKNPSGGAFKLPKNRLSPLFSPSAYEEKTMMVLVRSSDYAADVAQACTLWKTDKQNFLSVAVPNSNARGSPVKRPRDTRSRQPSEAPCKPRRLETGNPNISTGTAVKPCYGGGGDRWAANEDRMGMQEVVSPRELIPNPHVSPYAASVSASSSKMVESRQVPPAIAPCSSARASDGFTQRTVRSSAGPSSQGVSVMESNASAVNSQSQPQHYGRGVPPMLHTGRPSGEGKVTRQR